MSGLRLRASSLFGCRSGCNVTAQSFPEGIEAGAGERRRKNERQTLTWRRGWGGLRERGKGNAQAERERERDAPGKAISARKGESSEWIGEMFISRLV